MLDKIAVYFSSTVGMVLAVVAASLALALGVQTLRVGSWQADYRKLEDKAKIAAGEAKLLEATLKASNKELTTSIGVANAAVKAALEAGREVQKRLEAAKVERAELDKQLAMKVDGLKKFQPVSGVSDCEQAMEQINGLRADREVK